MSLTEKQKEMTPVQKLSRLVSEYLATEEKFNATQSIQWLKKKNDLKHSLQHFILQNREQELESRQLTLNI